jgi:hypothetical protein
MNLANPAKLWRDICSVSVLSWSLFMVLPGLAATESGGRRLAGFK